MTLQENIGRKIKFIREGLGMSQTTLAHLVGYKDKTSIAKIESGKVDLPQSKIFAFSSALNIPISFLFNDKVEKPNVVSAFAGLYRDEMKAYNLIQDYYKLYKNEQSENFYYPIGEFDETRDNNFEFNIHLCESEMLHIEKYRAIDDSARALVDTILDREYERVSRPVLMAAHNDHINEPGEKEKIEYDLANLKRP